MHICRVHIAAEVEQGLSALAPQSMASGPSAEDSEVFKEQVVEDVMQLLEAKCGALPPSMPVDQDDPLDSQASIRTWVSEQMPDLTHEVGLARQVGSPEAVCNVLSGVQHIVYSSQRTWCGWPWSRIQLSCVPAPLELDGSSAWCRKCLKRFVLA